MHCGQFFVMEAFNYIIMGSVFKKS